MSADWFDQWIAHHATVFGMDREQDLSTFHSWRNLFLGAGYTEAELFEATDWLAVNSPPRWRSEHLAAIQERVRSRRIEAASAKEKAEISWPSCSVCDGCGMAIVPHLRFVHEGRWISYHTCAVFCRCHRGQRDFSLVQAAKRRPMTLAEYELRNPDWVQQLEERRLLERAQLQARERSVAADRLYGPLLKRLAANNHDAG